MTPTNLPAFFQTHLAIDTHIAVTDTRVMVADTHIAVSDTHIAVADTQVVVAGTQAVVTDTHQMVADIHRKVLTGQEGTSAQNRSVRATHYLSTTEYLQYPRPKPGKRH